MKALSFLQPWLHAVLHLGKNIENRKWAPWPEMIGQTFALHASKGWDDSGAAFLGERGHDTGRIWSQAPRGAIVGTARLVGFAGGNTFPLDEVAKEILASPWFFGPVGWLLADVKELPQPIPCKGSLGFWRLPENVEAQLR